MTAAVALLQCRRRSAWLLESSWSVFLLLGWILIRRGFLPFRLSPRAHIHTHTLTKQVVSMACRGPGPLPP